MWASLKNPAAIWWTERVVTGPIIGAIDTQGRTLGPPDKMDSSKAASERTIQRTTRNVVESAG